MAAGKDFGLFAEVVVVKIYYQFTSIK